jgi:hypothetical protein
LSVIFSSTLRLFLYPEDRRGRFAERLVNIYQTTQCLIQLDLEYCNPPLFA